VLHVAVVNSREHSNSRKYKLRCRSAPPTLTLDSCLTAASWRCCATVWLSSSPNSSERACKRPIRVTRTKAACHNQGIPSLILQLPNAGLQCALILSQIWATDTVSLASSAVTAVSYNQHPRQLHRSYKHHPIALTQGMVFDLRRLSLGMCPCPS